MTEHRNHALKPQASGTSAHLHHRAWIEHGGIRVGYRTCSLSTDPHTRRCPDDPDPWTLMARKQEERRATRRGTRSHVVCEAHPPERWRDYGGGPVCLDCRSAQRRAERIAARIARDAVRVA